MARGGLHYRKGLTLRDTTVWLFGTLGARELPAVVTIPAAIVAASVIVCATVIAMVALATVTFHVVRVIAL